MQPTSHAIVSCSLGAAVWLFTKSFYAGTLCALSGVLIDLDHIIEYVIHHGHRTFNIRNLFIASAHTGRQEGKLRFVRLFLIFHTWEIAFFFWIAAAYTKDIYFLAIAMGYTSHMILDNIGNPGYPFSYFITWRMLKGFRTEKIFRRRS